VVPTGKIEHVVKEVLAKSVGDTASFLQFSGNSEVSFLEKECHYCMVEFIVVIVRSFERCLAYGSGRWSQGVSSLWCGECSHLSGWNIDASLR